MTPAQPAAVTRIGAVLAMITLVIIAGAWRASDGAIFSPGGLHAADSTPVARGGVSSHAALERRCDACHAAPWSGTRMDARCLACHDDTRQQLADTTTVHGSVDNARACTSCHGEHAGATTSVFRAGALADVHDKLGFALTGAHRRVACERCHKNARTRDAYGKAPKTCVACHKDDDVHRGGFGEECQQCHTTRRWESVTFRHTVFNIAHGARQPTPCKTCHENPKDYKQYTCYGCHEHSPARIARQHDEVRAQKLDDCLRCHGRGRGRD